MKNVMRWIIVAAGGVLTAVGGELFSQHIFKKTVEKQVADMLEQNEEVIDYDDRTDSDRSGSDSDCQ